MKIMIGGIVAFIFGGCGVLTVCKIFLDILRLIWFDGLGILFVVDNSFYVNDIYNMLIRITFEFAITVACLIVCIIAINRTRKNINYLDTLEKKHYCIRLISEDKRCKCSICDQTISEKASKCKECGSIVLYSKDI